MKQGGHLLSQIRNQLVENIKPGVTPLEIEKLANQLIDKTGGQASFKTVPNYHHATCININAGLVHGIPTDNPFQQGDLVSLDLGLLYQGFHTDTSTTVVAGSPTPKQKQFIDTGWQALSAGINQACSGNKVSHISKAIEKVITQAGLTPIRDLTGHGIGKTLHQDPYIPNYFDPSHPDITLKPGISMALEPMYTQGSHKIKVLDDGWTIATADHSLSCLVEHTIFITDTNPLVLTE